MLDWLDEETKVKITKILRERPDLIIGSGTPREDGTVDILLIGPKDGLIYKKMIGKAKREAVEREECIDVATEVKQKIYEKSYFETKVKAGDQLSYEEKYRHYSKMAIGLMFLFDLIRSSGLMKTLVKILKAKYYCKIAVSMIILTKIIGSKGNVLELGCGRGELVRSFNELGVNTYGIDVSEDGINLGLERAPFLKGKLILCDVDKEKLPFVNDYFNLVIMINTIEHVFCLRNCIEEVRRVLKPGGCVLIVTHIPESNYDVRDVTHVNVRSEEEWIRLFEKHGLYPIEAEKLERMKQQYIKLKPPSSRKGIEMVKVGKNKEREKHVWESIFGKRIVLVFYKSERT
jgi:ubiquinone/menaquinone biosynthesis C-methylase UbiE